MKSIREWPLKVYVTIAEVAETTDSPKMPSYQIEKPYDKLTPNQKKRIKVDERALSLLTMALPNDKYARVDSLGTAKEVWDEIELQLQGGEEAKKDEKEIAISMYEGFRAKEGEPLFDSYTRLNGFVIDLWRIGVQKSNYEVNVKFLKNLPEAWEQAVYH